MKKKGWSDYAMNVMIIIISILIFLAVIWYIFFKKLEVFNLL